MHSSNWSHWLKQRRNRRLKPRRVHFSCNHTENVPKRVLPWHDDWSPVHLGFDYQQHVKNVKLRGVCSKRPKVKFKSQNILIMSSMSNNVEKYFLPLQSKRWWQPNYVMKLGKIENFHKFLLKLVKHWQKSFKECSFVKKFQINQQQSVHHIGTNFFLDSKPRIVFKIISKL